MNVTGAKAVCDRQMMLSGVGELTRSSVAPSAWVTRRRRGAAARRRAINEQSLCCVEQFETAVTAAGGQVHWARDATARPTRIVVELVRAEDADELFKVKSMATQEFGLNEALAER